MNDVCSRIDNQTEDIIYEKLAVVDENYLVFSPFSFLITRLI